jgi:hypothetical protein
MVMQSGDVPAGGEDSNPAKPLPWKYILIAAVLAASILGIFFAATTGIFSSDPTPAASTNPISGASQPATNPIVLTDNEEDSRITEATKIPNPNEIVPRGTFIDISNPQEFVQISNSNLVITNIRINKINNKISANYINANPERSIAIKPALIHFFDESKNEIPREQWCCRNNGRNSPPEYIYGRALCAHCQWPEDYCYYAHDDKLWEEYWREKSGKKTIKTGTVGSTTKGYEEIIPTLKPGEKYSIIVPCEMPQNAKYIQIM